MPIHMELKDDRSEKVHYDYPDYPIYLRRGLLSNYPNYTAPVHWHDDIEFIAVSEGEMTYNVNGERILLKSGEGIIVNSRQMHFGCSDTWTECDFICALLHPMLLCAVSSCEYDFILPFLRNTTVPFLHLTPGSPWQQEILTQLKLMYANKNRKTAPLKIQSAFFEIWSLLCEQIPPESSQTNQESGDLTITKNMVGFIQQNYTCKLSLAQIAASGAVGQSKCCKLFSRYFNQSPILYLNQYRLNKSMELLRNTDLTITEIAFQCGFTSASYYAETFRKWIGKNPTESRREKI